MELEGIHVGLVFLAGFVSFASPCVLPLVPSFLGIVAGSHGSGQAQAAADGTAVTGKQLRLHGLAATAWFVAGFTLVFTVLGIAFAGVTLLFSPLAGIIQVVSGLIILVLAANLVFNFIPFLNYEKRVQYQGKSRPVFGPLVTGIAFGAGWSPCIGPILASILAYAGSSANFALSTAYLLVYGLGLGLPFLMLSLGLEFFKPMLAFLKRHHRAVKIVSALIMTLMGLLILFGQGTFFARKLPEAGLFLGRWAESAPQQVRAVGLLVLGLLVVLPAAIRLVLQLRRGENKRPVPSIIFLVLGLTLFILEAAGSLGGGLVAQVALWFRTPGL